jgi:hypothetical protein
MYGTGRQSPAPRCRNGKTVASAEFGLAIFAALILESYHPDIALISYLSKQFNRSMFS